jgi:penicillin-insensitive murein DD-endopeptidase
MSAARAGSVSLLAIAIAAAGCVGPLAQAGRSVSVGASGDGTVRRPAEMAVEGDGYAIPAPWRARRARFGTEGLVGAVVRAARQVEDGAPGAVAAIGDLSRQTGGSSAQHRSHQSGRDADIFYYAVDGAGRSIHLGDAMLHFAPDLRATRWSPPQGARPPARPVPTARFDVRRNWAFARALLRDSAVEVQWIFIQRDLAAALLAEAAREGDDPALVARASFILHEPSDSEPHDDHMHVRLYCDSSDRPLGCVDRGPVRWWKKRWKYMAPPFARPPVDGVREDDVASLAAFFARESLSVSGGQPTS